MNLVVILLVVALVVVLVWLIVMKSHLDPNDIYNPPKTYWFARSDKGGSLSWGGKYYMVQKIESPKVEGTCTLETAAKDCPLAFCRDKQCVPYTNAEIYNNPCCLDTISDKCDSLWKADPVASKIVSQNFGREICKLVSSVCKGKGVAVPEGLDRKDCNLVVNPSFVDIPTQELEQFVMDSFLNLPYLYADLTINVQAVGLKNGSRGWGFWNTQGSLSTQNTIWFIHQNGLNPDGSPYAMNGMYIMIVSSTLGKNVYKLPDLDEEFHKYRILWKKDSITFFVDGKQVFQETKVLVSQPTSFHCWVDNAVFGIDPVTLMPLHWNHLLPDGPRYNNVKSIEIKKV